MKTNLTTDAARDAAREAGRIVKCKNGYYTVRFPGVISRPRMAQPEAKDYLVSLRLSSYHTRPRKRIVLPSSLVAEYHEPATVHELAERHGCSHATVHNTLLERGCTMRRTGNRGPRNDGPMQRHAIEIRADRKLGASLAVIAANYGCSISTVHRICK